MVKVDENTCIGCGACVAMAPETFEFNEKGISSVITSETTENAKEAAEACPVGAISVEETPAE